MKNSTKLLIALRWIFALPAAWFVGTFILFTFRMGVLYFSFLPFSSTINGMILAVLSMFIGTFCAALIFVNLIPRFKGLALAVLNISYVIFQSFNTSKFGIEYFLLLSAFVSSCLVAYLIYKRRLAYERS